MNTTGTEWVWGVGRMENDYCEMLVRLAKRVRRDAKSVQSHRESVARNYKIGTVVSWQHSFKHARHSGTVVEIIPAGQYPNWWDGLKVNGYYREIESYVVRAENGKHYWPITAKLEKCNAPVHL